MFLTFLTVVSVLLNTPASTDLHTSASKQEFKLKIVKPFPRININLPWEGHLSAQNFKSPTEKIELKKVQRSLGKTILALPKNHTEALKTLEIRNKSHVSRGMANSKKMILNIGTIDNRKELSAVFIHEMGHVVDFGFLKGKARSGRSFFRDGKKVIYNDDLSLKFYKFSWQSEFKKQSTVHRNDFVSGYAMTDCFEDFAESYVFYRLHGEKFRALMNDSIVLKQKYEFLKQYVFESKEYQVEQAVDFLAQNLIWDVTLLDYQKSF